MSTGPGERDMETGAPLGPALILSWREACRWLQGPDRNPAVWEDTTNPLCSETLRCPCLSPETPVHGRPSRRPPTPPHSLKALPKPSSDVSDLPPSPAWGASRFGVSHPQHHACLYPPRGGFCSATNGANATSSDQPQRGAHRGGMLGAASPLPPPLVTSRR